MDAHDDAGKAVGQVQGSLHVFQQAFVGDAAVILEQRAVEAEVGAQHLGDAEGDAVSLSPSFPLHFPFTTCIHRMACPAHDKAVGALLNELTQAAFVHPETGARMMYELA